MPNDKQLSKTFKDFFESEKSSGVLLVLCTAVSLVLANSAAGSAYIDLWHAELGGLSVEHWINDLLMAVFFLLIGLELERELYVGELADFRNALLPIVAAAGGVALPAVIHFSLNAGTPTQAGIGIPMATDIAFAVGILALLGSSVPASLKVFLVALAVMDDLAAIVVIAVFYSADLSLGYLVGALAVFGALVVLNRMRVMVLLPYIVGGLLMWLLMYRSGVHATIAGVSDDIEHFRFNKAIARIYEFLNALKSFATTPALRDADLRSAPQGEAERRFEPHPEEPRSGVSKEARAEALYALVRLIAPFTPHLAEEAHEHIGGKGFVCDAPWPKADPALLVKSTVILGVQVNGKRRGEIEIAADATNADAEKAALALDEVKRHIGSGAVKKIVVVPGRIVNIVAG